MRDREYPIDVYLSQLARRLPLPAAERDQVLAEVLGHLVERALALRDSGSSQEQAEHQAVLSFGPVGRISRELRASHPIAWGKRRWLVGMLTGAGGALALWLLATVPVVSYSSVLSGWPPIPIQVFNSMLGSLLSSSTLIQDYLWLGWLAWLWAVPFLVLYLVLPFVWGRQALHWWVPGLAYGLGAWFPAALELVFVFTFLVRVTDLGSFGPGVLISSYLMIPLAWFIVVAPSLALAASFVGWLWRERSAAALGRAQAA